MDRPIIKRIQEWRDETLVEEVRFLLDAYELDEASQIPHYQRAVLRAALEMACGPEVWKWIEERTQVDEAHTNVGSSCIGRVS